MNIDNRFEISLYLHNRFATVYQIQQWNKPLPGFYTSIASALKEIRRVMESELTVQNIQLWEPHRIVPVLKDGNKPFEPNTAWGESDPKRIDIEMAGE